MRTRKRFLHSFGYAGRGLFQTVRRERNMRFHCCAALYVIAAGIVTRISTAEWGVVLVCIGAVLAAECMNTAAEHLADRITRAQDPEIRQAKDSAAGGVLIAAAAAAAAGSVIFFSNGRPALAWAFAREHTALAAALLAAAVPLGFWIFWPRKRGRKSEAEKEEE